jgi:hypothetical protein
LINVAPISDQVINQPNAVIRDDNESCSEELLPKTKNDPGAREAAGANQKNEPNKPDPKFLVYAFAGCACFASAGIIRKF